jgi:hypothetical protein
MSSSPNFWLPRTEKSRAGPSTPSTSVLIAPTVLPAG